MDRAANSRYFSLMANRDDLQVSRDHQGRFVARAKQLPNCMGYGKSEPEAIAELHAVRATLYRPNGPRLSEEPTGQWRAESTIHPNMMGCGDTPAKALAALYIGIALFVCVGDRTRHRA